MKSNNNYIKNEFDFCNIMGEYWTNFIQIKSISCNQQPFSFKNAQFEYLNILHFSLK